MHLYIQPQVTLIPWTRMRSTKGELEVVTNFQDDVSYGQDVMSKM
jgi:hypothetical protein